MKMDKVRIPMDVNADADHGQCVDSEKIVLAYG
jgi:hypothetical protein